MIEQFYDLKPQVLELDRKTLELCRDQFAHLEEIRDYNQLKMLRAFTDCGVEARHFLPPVTACGTIAAISWRKHFLAAWGRGRSGTPAVHEWYPHLDSGAVRSAARRGHPAGRHRPPL